MIDLEIERGYAPVTGGQLYYEVAGSGHPLVLTHAGVADHRMWDEQFPAFARHYRTIRYDFRGFGQSSGSDVPFAYHQDLHDLLAHLGVEHAYVCGLSMGGLISLNFTLAYPQMVDALILTATGAGHNPPSTELRDWWDRINAAEELGNLEAANELELQLWVDGPHRGAGAVDPAMRARVEAWNLAAFKRPAMPGKPLPLDPPAARLHEITAPTLIIVGDADVSDVVTNADLLARDIPHAQKVVLPNVAHMVNMERPQEFTDLVLAFLAPLES